MRNATALGATRGSAGDAEYAIRQLVEVAVRALSPGINDPHTAMSVLDRLGAALCDLAGTHLPSGVTMRDDAVALVVPSVSYRSLADVMFHMIRQNAAGSTAVMIRLLDVLTAVDRLRERPGAYAQCWRDHADLVWPDAQRDIRQRSRPGRRRPAPSTRLQRTLAHGALGAIGARGLQPRRQNITMLDIAAICLVVTALLAYLNHRFVRLPTTIGVMAIALGISLVMVGLDALGLDHGLREYEESFLRSIDFSGRADAGHAVVPAVRRRAACRPARAAQLPLAGCDAGAGRHPGFDRRRRRGHVAGACPWCMSSCRSCTACFSAR